MMLRAEIQEVLNKHSAEHASNTPEYVLANFLIDCLTAFDTATQKREAWHARRQKFDEEANQ